jgi:hypothetical protein
MEEIEKLKVVALDQYLGDQNYAQVEDLLATCSLNLSVALSSILLKVYEVRGTGKNPDLDSIAKDLRTIIQHVAVMAHCLDLYVPELEELEEFIEDEFDDDSLMDTTMCALSIQHIYSNMILDHYAGGFDSDNPDMVDLDMMQVGIIDMLASTLAICNRYKLNFIQVIVYG